MRISISQQYRYIVRIPTYHALNSKFANFETPCINKKYWQVTIWQRYFLSSVVMNSSVGSLIACLSKFVSQSALAVIDIF
jgi:hypothetical protein